MINEFKLVEIANSFGCELKPFVDIKFYRGAYDPDNKVIELYIGDTEQEIFQTLIHECAHTLDPVCQRENEDISEAEVFESELRAEIATKYVCGNSWIDDGAIDELQAEVDINRALDIISEASKIAEIIEARL
jgi:hypothetical protein